MKSMDWYITVNKCCMNFIVHFGGYDILVFGQLLHQSGVMRGILRCMEITHSTYIFIYAQTYSYNYT